MTTVPPGPTETKSHKVPFTLVESHTSADTVKCLEEMLARAEEGELIGLAFAAMFKFRGFTVNATGEAIRNPTFSRGMANALDDFLAARVVAAKKTLRKGSAES